MKTELQNLIYERVCEILDDMDKLVMNVTQKTINEKDSINHEKDIYPINQKIREAKNWMESLIDENENK